MASNTYGAIKLSTAEDVGAVLKKKTGSADGYKPKEWADTINLMGLLPIRTASGTIAHFSDGAEDVPMKSVVANITPIQSGTGTPSPSNPRPISGTSVLNVEQRGKNLFDDSRFSDYEAISACKVLKNALPNDVLLTMSFTDKDTSVNISDVYFGFVLNSYNGGLLQQNQFHWTIQNGTVRARTDNQSEDLTTLCSGIIIYPATEDAYNRLTARYDIQIELGSTATTYEAYKGETYPIALGQTVYGGSADVVGGTGEETHGIVDLGDLTWTYRTDVLGVPCFLSNDISDIKNGSLPIACSCLEIKSPNRTAIDGNYQVSIGNNTNAKYLVIRYDEYTDGTAVKTALTGQKLVYELATPTDFTFTGQPINSYLGVNNVWTDSGEVLDVEYRADMNLLIAELGG